MRLGGDEERGMRLKGDETRWEWAGNQARERFGYGGRTTICTIVEGGLTDYLYAATELLMRLDTRVLKRTE